MSSTPPIVNTTSSPSPTDNNGPINNCDAKTSCESDSVRDEEKRSETHNENKYPNPFFYCKFVANHPGISFSLMLSGHLLMTFTTGILVLAGYDLFPTNFDTLPLQLKDQPWLKRDLAFRDRKKYDNYVARSLTSNLTSPKYRYKMEESVEMIYDMGSDNIFQKSHLLKIKEIEDTMTHIELFDKYCQLIKISGKDICLKPLSIIRFFDGTYSSVDPVFNDPGFDNITAVLYKASVTNKTKGIFKYTLCLDHVITQSRVYAPMTRSLIPLGSPIKNTSSPKDEIKKYLKQYMKPKLETFKSTSQFEFIYYSYEMMLADVREQALLDMMLAIGSVLFIWVFMCYHTRSLWVTSLAVYSILSSFMGTNLIYRIVLDYRYFGFFHILAIFIVLGIGADDLFVFYDAWRATAFKSYPSVAHRLTDAYRKSALSMLITSLTTMFAFVASAVSPLLATKSFGVFSGILVLINYISVILFFPTVVVFYHKHFEKYNCCCCNIFTKTNEEGSIKEKEQDFHPVKLHYAEKLQPALKKKKPRLVRFFRDYHFKFVTNKFAKWIIICVFLTLVGFFGYQTSRLEAENEQLQLYKKSHNYAKAIDRNLYSFVPNEVDKFITVYLVWGLKERDLSGCHFSAVGCKGSQVFDDSFDASVQEAQLAFKVLCDDILRFTEEEIRRYKIRRDIVTGELEVSCFTRKMEKFLRSDPAASNLSVALPWDWTTTYRFMSSMPSLYDINGFNSTFSRYLDIPLTYWLYDGFTMNPTEDYIEFSPLFGEVKDTFTQKVRSKNATIGNRIKYLAVQINTTLNGQSLSYTDGIPVVQAWEQFMKKQLAKMPATLQGGFQVTRIFWHWLYIQKALADNAILGIVIGLSLAFPILVLATQNIIIGFLATVCIGCVTVCVIGVIPLAGWKLGVLVSLNMCLVVGLSVDFIVHMAEGYHLSERIDRKSRVQDTLESMGVPVFSGACTTLGASFFMLFAKIQFFFQFGIFMFCTIGFSLLFSMCLFVTVLGIIGPNGDQGDFVAFFKKYCCKKKSSVSPRESSANSPDMTEQYSSHL